ncbi:hypothetical protein X798_07412 [Onchocerca flexuosa]|uniref:Uncharacterized protein n=1 Tax=Onchocerca flexuosa TaxID=387005 RepID=A0A238BKN3_9BILA|nr:hypothetical protein X798_07412 [Onchocerca flexuosa]
MRRDIPQINNVRDENELDEGAKLMYEALCRQEVPVDTKARSRLYCYYKMDRPYLRLAPFKVEIVRQNPLVALFYDIVSDEEVRSVQMLALPKACLVFLILYYPYSFSRSEKRKNGHCIQFRPYRIGIKVISVQNGYNSQFIDWKP